MSREPYKCFACTCMQLSLAASPKKRTTLEYSSLCGKYDRPCFQPRLSDIDEYGTNDGTVKNILIIDCLFSILYCFPLLVGQLGYARPLRNRYNVVSKHLCQLLVNN